MMRVLRRFLLVCGLLAGIGSAHAQDKIEVITLNYRSADEMLPLIQPLVGKDGAVTGLQNRLIIRARPARVAEIKRVIASLDTRPRRLMITVRQNATRESLAQEAEVYGTLGNGRIRARLPKGADGTPARIELGRGRDRLGAEIHSTRDIEQSGDTQRVQVLEGNTALIRVGQSLPYAQRRVVRDAFGATVVEETGFQEIGSGVLVLPRVSGDQVTLEIQPQRERRLSSGAIDRQQAATVIGGRLGEWLELGGVGRSGSDHESGIASSTEAVSADNRSIFVKVEELP